MNNIVSNSTIPDAPAYLKIRLQGLKKCADLHPEDKKAREIFFFFSTVYFYSKIPLDKKHIVCGGYVFNDGVGDYYHVLNSAEWIKSKFPSFQVSMFINHHDKRCPNVVRKPIDPDIQVHFCAVGEKISDEAYTMLRDADYFIEMSQWSNNRDVLNIIEQKVGRYMFIGEYGLKTKMAMGIKPDQLGIVIKDPIQPTSLNHLNHSALKEILFGTSTPSEADLKNYFQWHCSFFSYLKMGSYCQSALIYTVSALLALSGSKIADLIVPKVKTEFLDLDFLKQQGIAKIQVISFEKNQTSIEEISLSNEGGVLRLINPFPLEQSDFYSLMTSTSFLVGCTGDNSLSEVLSFGRLPFYELRELKKEFWEQLITISHNQKGMHLKEYLQELYYLYDDALEDIIKIMDIYDKVSGNIDELPEIGREAVQKGLAYFKSKQSAIATSALKLARLIMKPELLREYQRLNVFLRNNCSFNPLLTHMVERALALASHPFLKDAVKSIEKSYLLDEITIQEAYELLTTEISRNLLSQS